jgi:hypothetical protein
MTDKREKNNQKLAARFLKANTGKTVTLDELQQGFKTFAKSITNNKRVKTNDQQ